jgi:putative transposase
MSDDIPPGRPRSGGRPTIADVNERASVGAITVSRALRNPGSVSEGRRRSIEKAVRELDYMPNRQRRRGLRPGDKWHLDEVFIRVQGVQHHLWRAVDQDGVVVDILVQGRRDAKAAKRFFKRLLKGLQYVPRVIVTDKLKSYGAARRHLLPGVEHRQSRYLNNRAENSHRPTRRRERQMQRFKSPDVGAN